MREVMHRGALPYSPRRFSESSAPGFLSELFRREARVLFEVFSEETLVGEVEFLGNLLDALIGIGQQLAAVSNDIIGYPLRHTGTRLFFDK